jgi:Cof subfamily protein (haloacid dehalogenase superfamily)
MYKAAFIDMDGTLLRKDHTVSEQTQKLISQLINKGILIVPISARPLHGMQPILQTFIPAHIPVVSLNGSYIYHNGDIIYQVNINAAEAEAVHQLVSEYPVTPIYYSQMDWYAHTDNPATQKEQKITPIPVTIQPASVTLQHWANQQNGPNKILIAGDPGHILELEKALVNQFGRSLNIFKSQPRYVEVIQQQASKTLAMQMLMNKFGIAQQEVVAIGDNYNDKDMIAFAGMGVAMGNAPDEIKQAADFITDTNNNDGVAKALQQFFK